MTSVVLVGFMGTGKTVVGQALAARLQYTFVDTDELITQRAGKFISNIFSDDGEPAFRALETELLRYLTGQPLGKQVISTGGGIVLAEHNWPLLRRLGDVICLGANPESILQRVGKAQDRPLLAGTRAEAWERIQTLLAQREIYYAKADWTCDTNKRTVPMIVNTIVQWQEAKTS